MEKKKNIKKELKKSGEVPKICIVMDNLDVSKKR